MTHASRGHECKFCGKVSFGNGGEVAHGRSHVRRGESVELVKHYATYPPMSHRVFLATNDPAVQEWVAKGFSLLGSDKNYSD